jgi:cob(I)alamin adenosyltransferase
MAKVYTKKGDAGMTAQMDNAIVSKSAAMIELYGCLDELNAFLAWTAVAIDDNDRFSDLSDIISDAQSDLIHLWKIIMPQAAKNKLKGGANCSSEKLVHNLEKAIDGLDKKLPKTKSFVALSGGEIASRLHIVRAVCRRVERMICCIAEDFRDMHELIDVMQYLNRLGDLLFVAARYATIIEVGKEIFVK